jgi:hypothetical protein
MERCAPPGSSSPGIAGARLQLLHRARPPRVRGWERSRFEPVAPEAMLSLAARAGGRARSSPQQEVVGGRAGLGRRAALLWSPAERRPRASPRLAPTKRRQAPPQAGFAPHERNRSGGGADRRVAANGCDARSRSTAARRAAVVLRRESPSQRSWSGSIAFSVRAAGARGRAGGRRRSSSSTPRPSSPSSARRCRASAHTVKTAITSVRAARRRPSCGVPPRRESVASRDRPRLSSAELMVAERCSSSRSPLRARTCARRDAQADVRLAPVRERSPKPGSAPHSRCLVARRGSSGCWPPICRRGASCQRTTRPSSPRSPTSSPCPLRRPAARAHGAPRYRAEERLPPGEAANACARCTRSPVPSPRASPSTRRSTPSVQPSSFEPTPR